MDIRHARDTRQTVLLLGRIDMAFLIAVAIFLRKGIKDLVSPEQLFWIKRRVYQPKAVSLEEKDDHPPARNHPRT